METKLFMKVFAGVWFLRYFDSDQKNFARDSAFRKEKTGHVATHSVSFSGPCHMTHATYSHNVI